MVGNMLFVIQGSFDCVEAHVMGCPSCVREKTGGLIFCRAHVVKPSQDQPERSEDRSPAGGVTRPHRAGSGSLTAR